MNFHFFVIVLVLVLVNTTKLCLCVGRVDCMGDMHAVGVLRTEFN